MPLEIIAGAEARRRQRGAAGHWPKTPEEQGRRLSPIAKPEFQPSFEIARDELIFTVGSCFARNLEKQMAIEGFNVAASRLQLPGVPNGLGSRAVEALNKFVCHSILQELRWSLEDGASFPEEGYLEIQPGKWIDPHLTPVLRPAALELVQSRRRAIQDYFALAAQARVVVITLGLAEAWFDNRLQLYLNGGMFDALIEREPERFEAHILDYNQILECLEAIHALLTSKGHPELRILITVSPVALGSSFSGADAIVANCYSKSVQRAATEAFVRRHANVDYFASYESVTLSDRRRAWRPDQAHVSDELVRYNVLRMLAAYSPDGGSPNPDAVDQAYQCVETARLAVAEGRRPDADAAYRRAIELAGSEGLIRTEFAWFLVRTKRPAEAVDQAKAALEAGSASYGGYELLATALYRAGGFEKAAEAIEQASSLDPDGLSILRLRSQIFEKLGRLDEALHFAVRALDRAKELRNAKLDHFERRHQELLSRLSSSEHLPEGAAAKPKAPVV